MMPLLLASWLSTQTWAWSPVPNATAYRVYWSHTANEWCTSSRLEFPASVCVSGECQGDVPQPAWDLAFFVVTAVNANGESPTDHGEIRVCP
jgi:hypothetical protein